MSENAWQVPWSARSPDLLNPPYDFYAWDYMKQLANAADLIKVISNIEYEFLS